MATYTVCDCGVKISTEGLWAVCTECNELAPVSEMGFRCNDAEQARSPSPRGEHAQAVSEQEVVQLSLPSGSAAEGPG